MTTQSPLASRKRFGLARIWMASCLLVGAFFLWKGFHPTPPQSTPVSSHQAAFREASPLRAKPIEEMQVGERVTTQLSERARVEAIGELGGVPWWDGVKVDPETWRRIELSSTNSLGHPSQIVLLRPLRWIDEHAAGQNKGDILRFGDGKGDGGTGVVFEA